VSIEPAQFIFDSIWGLPFSENPSVPKRGKQVAQCGAQLVPGPLHRLWAVALRKVLIKKALNIVICQIGHGKPAMTGPASEVRDPAQVHPRGFVSVSSLNEAMPIRRYEGGQVTVSQPRGWHMVNRS